MNATPAPADPGTAALPSKRSKPTRLRACCLAGICALVQTAAASTTITSGNTFTIDAGNSTNVADVLTWNDTGTLTIHGGGTLRTYAAGLPTKGFINNAAIVFAGSGGTLNMHFNGNDTDHTLAGASITSTATGAQTLDLRTGYAGNGDRGTVTFNAGIPNVGDGSVLAVNVTFRTQTGANSYVNLKGANTFTGPLTLAISNSPTTGYLTIGGSLTRFNGNTIGTGRLGGGNYPGAITLPAATILNYASTATQTLSGVISGAGAVQVTGSGALTLAGANTYTGNTTVNSGCSLVVGGTGGMKFMVSDATSNKITGAGSATLNGTFTVDTSAVTVTSGTWPLVTTTTKSFGGAFNLAGFTGPVGNLYTKAVGGQTWTFDKSTGVLALSSKAIITAFGIAGSAGVINQTTKTIALTVPYTPWGANGLAALAPTFTVTTGTCNQTSGSPPSPTFAAANPVTYAVTDGAVVNPYAVTVTITPPSAACDMLTCNFGALGPAAISGGTALLTVPPGQPVTALAPTFTLSANATISPASGSTQDFSNPVTYRVTAENGTTVKDYVVSVQSFATWAHSGSLFLLTTPEGANLAAGASESNFPLLVRLNSANFNFAEAQPDGRDLRLTTAAGAALSYQIEHWDAVNGTAAVWVRIPTITGNSRQELRLYWGKSGVTSLSSGAAVFNSSNGYASVIHLGDTLVDERGATTPANSGTTATAGLIGKCRTFAAGTGIACGTGLTTLPAGGNPHSSQVWIRATASNSTVLGWGLEQGQGKVVMQLANPPRMNMDCYFGGANVTGIGSVPLSQWVQVVHTYQSNAAKLYVNGVLDNSTGGGTMNIPATSRLDLGGWYGTNTFVGDMDEVRLSSVVRSANWVKLEYENQKPLQTLVGGIVPAGGNFAVSPTQVTLNENSSTTLTAEAGGAQKLYWVSVRNGQETVLAVDQLTLNYAVGRITGNQSDTLRLKAVYPTEVKTLEVPVTITDTIPDPMVSLTAPATWDGRQPLNLTSAITNLSDLQAAGATSFNYKWTVGGVAVIKQAAGGTLALTRSQGSGQMTVTLTMDNGGAAVSQSVTITVQEPAGGDPWAQRTPDANEKPVTKQFFARDPGTGLGTIHYRGTQAGASEVYLKVYTTDTGADVPYATHRQPVVSGSYAFAAPVAAGKVTYKVTYGTTSGGVDSAPLATVSDLVCGDAFIIEGQSNALATDNAAPNDTATTNKWVRTYGLTSGWGYAISKGNDLQLGLWGWYLANRLVANNNMPVCIINGAVGGTRIDQHRPNPAGHGTAGSLYSIYANLYNRVVGARLTHGIRGLFWHQGEQDQGSGGPDGDYDYKFYQQYFVDISAAWKQDFPNLRNYYLFQIWPAACGDTSRNDQLREVQRTLPLLYSNMKIMSTLGIVPGSSCHYEPAGYQVFADLIGPLVEQDVYGFVPPGPLTAPNLRKARFTTAARNEIALVFDQAMAWNPGAPTMLFLANSSGSASGSVTSGSAAGTTLKLPVTGASSAATLTYVKGLTSWQQPNILYGTNGIAALTFADVAIGPPAPANLTATATGGQVALSWSAAPGATSYTVKRSLTPGGPYTALATVGGTTHTDTTTIGGKAYYYVVSANRTVGSSTGEGLDSNEASATPLTAYQSWAADPAQELAAGVNDGPLLDPDFDGVANLMEFVLRGAPTVASRSGLPELRNAGDQWTFEYDRNDASLPPATIQTVQYGSDLDGWTGVTVPATSQGSVTITPGSPTDRVSVALPDLGGRGFVRLAVSQ
jgi:autotransporter-associated beta strand protein